MHSNDLIHEEFYNMTEKELRRLNRRDILILLAEQTGRADKLEEKLKEKEKELEELRASLQEVNMRNFELDQCGSMAEAALILHDVFKAADKAAEEYIANVKAAYKHQHKGKNGKEDNI